MNQYDIIFVGNMGKATIVPFGASSFFDRSCPVIYSSVAAACMGKKIAVVTTISEREEGFLKPMRDAGIDLFVRPGDIMEIRVVFPTANVDERQTFVLKDGTALHIAGIPVFESRLIHFCWMLGRVSQSLHLLRALKTRRFRLSIDMQAFVLQADEKGTVHLREFQGKKRS